LQCSSESFSSPSASHDVHLGLASGDGFLIGLVAGRRGTAHAARCAALPACQPFSFSAFAHSNSTFYQYLGYRSCAMTDTNSDEVPAEPSSGVEAPCAGAEEQGYVHQPWGSGSNPSIPSIDNGDNNVSLNAYSLLHLLQPLR